MSRSPEETANAAEFAVRAATSELQRAEARLAPSRPEAPGRVVSVTAPVDGVVLKRVRESETFVPAGDPLIEIGDPGSAGNRRGPAVDGRRSREGRRPRHSSSNGAATRRWRRESGGSSRPASRRSRRSASRNSA